MNQSRFGDSPGADRLKRIASLHHAKYRRRYGLSIVEGVRAVAAAVRAGAPLVDVLVAESAASRVEKEIGLGNLPAMIVSDEVVSRLSAVDSDQGVVATFSFRENDLGLDARALDSAILLDGVQDPGNVGTIIRTAAWYGVHAVVAGPGTADFSNPKVVRSTMGALWLVRLYQTRSLVDAIGVLRHQGFVVLAASADGSTAPPAGRATALVLGSEAHGLADEVLRMADGRVSIEPAGGLNRDVVDSLNVSVAAGILADRVFGRR